MWNHWLDLSDWEVREAMGLVDESRYLELFKKYVKHVSHHLKRERMFDPVTGDLRDPDEKFMQGLEKTMDPKAGPNFRADLLSRIGAWALSHPDEEPAYAEIFADYFGRLREDYYRQQKAVVGRGIQRMLELLELPAVRAEDNFYALGGDSLRLMQLLLRLNQTFGTMLVASRFRKLATLGELAAHIERHEIGRASCRERVSSPV